MSDHEGRLEKLQMYVEGAWVAPLSGQYLETMNPFTAKPWSLVPRGNAEDADRAVQAAHRAFKTGPWSRMHPTDRGKLLHRLGVLMEARAEQLAEIEVRDNGRLLAEMRHQVQYTTNW